MAPRWPAGLPVLVGACQFGTAWAGLRLNPFIHEQFANTSGPGVVFSVITFVPRYSHAANGVCVFRPTTQSRFRLSLVVRCGITKNMPFCTFFYVQPKKYQNGAIFVNSEGLRPCLSKPSYGASQWALMARLKQKNGLNRPRYHYFRKPGHWGHFGYIVGQNKPFWPPIHPFSISEAGWTSRKKKCRLESG